MISNKIVECSGPHWLSGKPHTSGVGGLFPACELCVEFTSALGVSSGIFQIPPPVLSLMGFSKLSIHCDYTLWWVYSLNRVSPDLCSKRSPGIDHGFPCTSGTENKWTDCGMSVYLSWIIKHLSLFIAVEKFSSLLVFQVSLVTAHYAFVAPLSSLTINCKAGLVNFTV